MKIFNSIPSKICLRIWVALMCVICSANALAFTADHYADTSKLASGRWVKIKVTNSGLHAITAADALLSNMSSRMDRIRVFYSK